MFRNARIKLTILYSLIFLFLFWSLSFGIYSWMNQFFGDQHKRGIIHNEQTPNTYVHLPEPASDIIMDELRNILLLIDLSLLLGIPLITWFLTGRTLAPVQKAHNREKQFLTNASHDLRTPLAIMRAEMEVALRKKRTAEEYKKTINSSKEEVEDLIALVENLLFINREAGNNTEEKQEIIDLTDLLAERVNTFHLSAKNKEQELTFTPPQESLVILGNTQRLKRLFTNLIDNAIKYTPTKGKIAVVLTKANQQASIEIRDTGIGIVMEQQEQVFDRFYRGDTSRSEKGYGLGLSIAKQIVAAYHGTIILNSKPHHGTTVTVTFPLVKKA